MALLAHAHALGAVLGDDLSRRLVIGLAGIGSSRDAGSPGLHARHSVGIVMSTFQPTADTTTDRVAARSDGFRLARTPSAR